MAGGCQKEQAWNLQQELISEYSADEFQHRLHAAWQSLSAHDRALERNKLCSEVQYRILPKYGFEASQQGVALSIAALSTIELELDKELSERNTHLCWLLSPEKQAQQPCKATAGAAEQTEQPAFSEKLSPQRAWALQDDLIVAFSKDAFQKQLHATCKAAGNNADLAKKASDEVQFNVLVKIVPKYGFDPSLDGVQACNLILFSPETNSVKELAERNLYLKWLCSPALQSSRPRPKIKSQSTAKAPVSKMLSREQGWALQDELLSAFSSRDFQKRLHEIWRANKDDPAKQAKEKAALCLEIQGPIISKYGFEPSRKGVMMSYLAFSSELKQDPEILYRNSILDYLVNPDKQVDVQAQGVVHITRADTGASCTLTIDLADDVHTLRNDILRNLEVPQLAQRLFIDMHELHGAELLSNWVTPGVIVDVMVLPRPTDVLHWLTSLKEDKDSKKKVLCLSEAPPELLTDPIFMCPAVELHDRCLQHAPPEMRACKQVVMRAVCVNGKALQFASDQLRKDRQVVMAAVQQDGWALEFAARTLQGDHDVVLAAIRQDGWAFQFATSEVQAKRDIVLEAVHGEAWVISTVAPEFQHDVEVVLAAVRQDWHVLEDLPSDLRKSKALMLAVVREAGDALDFADAELRADHEVVLAAVQSTGQALRFASRQLRADRKVGMAAVLQDGLAFSLLAAELQDLDMAKAAVEHHPHSVQCIEHSLLEKLAKVLGGKMPAWTGANAHAKPPQVEPTDLVDAKLRKHLKTLGLPFTASPDEVRKRYRQLALQCHPDKHPDDVDGAKQKFQLINTAYQVLRQHLNM